MHEKLRDLDVVWYQTKLELERLVDFRWGN